LLLINGGRFFNLQRNLVFKIKLDKCKDSFEVKTPDMQLESSLNVMKELVQQKPLVLIL